MTDWERVDDLFDLKYCESCGVVIARTAHGPYLDAVQHLQVCVALRAELLDWSVLDYDVAEDDLRERG